MVESAITQVELSIKESIRIHDQIKVDAFTRVLAQLASTWIEVRVYKLIYEPNAFTDSEITNVLQSETLQQKWENALNYSYFKHFQISDPQKITDNKYTVLCELIKSDFTDSITIRNRLAHGQWKYAFNSNVTSISSDLTTKIQNENVLKIQIKLQIFKDIAQIIHDLTVSRPTFDRDYNKYFNRVCQNKRHYATRDFQKFEQILRRSYERGKIRKTEQNKSFLDKVKSDFNKFYSRFK